MARRWAILKMKPERDEEIELEKYELIFRSRIVKNGEEIELFHPLRMARYGLLGGKLGFAEIFKQIAQVMENEIRRNENELEGVRRYMISIMREGLDGHTEKGDLTAQRQANESEEKTGCD